MESKRSGSIVCQREVPQHVDFSARNQKLKTAGQSRKQTQRLEELAESSQNLTKESFWKQKVRTREDVVLYYQLYYPEYDDNLVRAIAQRLENLINKYNCQQPLTDEDKKLIKSAADKKSGDTSLYWDPKDDILNQQLEGKIALAGKRMEELLRDCE